MTTDLTRIHRRLEKTIQLNFKKTILIEAKVESINIVEKSFVIYENDKTLECKTDQNLESLCKDDQISIKGLLKRDLKYNGKIYLDVECFHKLEEAKYINLEMYDKLYHTLCKDKCQKIVQKLKTQKAPYVVMNIGLITVPDNERNIKEFEHLFEEKCKGQLFIFRLKQDEVESSLRVALEYFKKYRNIDIICLLTNKLTLGNISDLSSKDNVKYLLNRKNFPYILSIVSERCDDNLTKEPLTALLSTDTAYGIENGIEAISNIQKTFKDVIEQNINLANNFLRKIIDDYKKRLLDLKLFIEGIASPTFMGRINPEIVIGKLKSILINRLQNERIKLAEYQITLMKQIIDDPNVRNVKESEILNENMEKLEIRLPDKVEESKTGIQIDQEDF